jgi:hypothetical protein
MSIFLVVNGQGISFLVDHIGPFTARCRHRWLVVPSAPTAAATLTSWAQ